MHSLAIAMMRLSRSEKSSRSGTFKQAHEARY